MQMSLHKFTFVLLLLSIAAIGSAQQQQGKGIGNEDVIVVKEYEATIQDAQKINIPPNIPEVEETKPSLDYTIPQHDYKDIAFEANPLKPLAMSKEKLESFNSSYIKVGFGSQLMPLAELAYNDDKTKNLKFGFYYDHLSAKGYTIHNQQFSDDLAGAYLKYFPKKFEIGVDLSFHNYRTHFYGTDSFYTEKQARQALRTYNALVYFKNARPNKLGIDVKQTLDFNYFQERYGGAYEWYFDGQTNLQKSFLKYHAVTLDVNFDVSQFNNTLFFQDRSLVTPLLGYGFNNDDWKAHLKVGITFDNGKPIFVCDAHVEKRLYEHAVIAYLSYVRTDQKNSLESFSYTNNFVQDNINLLNSVNGDLGLGIKGTAQNFSYNAAFHFNHVHNMPFFINDSIDLKRFLVVYDYSTLVFNFHYEAGYNIKEWLRLSIFGDYNDYVTKGISQPFNEPNFRTTLRGDYIWKNKIKGWLEVYGISGATALLPDRYIVNLKGTADVNLGAEYLFNKHLSFFAMLNNIANIKYMRWYNYQGFGINGMIGGKFSF
jgi:hypothetical protein